MALPPSSPTDWPNNPFCFFGGPLQPPGARSSCSSASRRPENPQSSASASIRLHKTKFLHSLEAQSGIPAFRCAPRGLHSLENTCVAGCILQRISIGEQDKSFEDAIEHPLHTE